ncbi:uncharacterized protein LOC123559692 [Mercenaria mercenaria]|uniref:uncharacterized protein LOC123559692 n=1 Tax=Mercenaria mercenaria TaxID=6596 RepID=UPI00234E61F3|nr:uncharacterized protein LOC123559692 [Mercenaria mercenaria]
MRNFKEGLLLITLFYVTAICLKQCYGATQAPNTGQPTQDGTTTPTAETTTTATTTTTAGTTTSTEAPTTTQQDTTTQAATTAQPKQYCGDSSNGLFLPFGDAEGDTRLNKMADGCHAPSAQTNDYKVAFEDKCFKKFHICVNGLVCLQNPYNGYVVPNHGQKVNVFNNRYCMAPFLTNLDTTNGGDVWFHEYDITVDCSLKTDSAVQKAQELFAKETGDLASSFSPVYVLVVTWDSVAREGGPSSETVTFQLLYASNGITAYSFYVYKQGGMGIPTGEVFIGQIVNGAPEGVWNAAVSDDQYRGVDETLSWSGGECYGATAYSHSASACQNTPELTCKKWHSCEKQNKATYLTQFNSLPRCPCSSAQTGANFVPKNISTITTEYFVLNSAAVDIDYGKTCGYRILESGSTSFVSTGNYRGSFAKNNPISKKADYQQYDRYYRNVCCDQADLCDLYFDVRPASQNCTSTSTSATSNSAGDPHFTTIDGLSYTFNGHGEYHLLNIDNIGFGIQARTERVLAVNGTSADATVFTAFAVKGTDFWMQVELNSDRTLLSVLSGTGKSLENHVDHTLNYYSQGNEFNVNEAHLSMRRTGETLFVTFPEAGVVMNITKGVGLLSSIFSIGIEHKTKTSGLLGNFNGQTNDDLIPRNSDTAIPASSNDEAIFLNFGKTWATNKSESEFAYPPGKMHASFNFPDFTPLFESSFSDEQLAEARSKCGLENKQCIFDFLLSDDETLALGTLTAFDDFREVTIIAENQIPTIDVISGATETDGAYYLQATLNSANTVQVKATDDGTVTTDVTSDISGIQRTNNPDGSVSVVFTLTSSNPVSLSFVATDNLGVVSPQLVITIVLCQGCSTHGACNFTVFQETGTVLDNFKLALCTCDEYWEGDNCEIDFDGCAAAPCFEGQNCTDTNADANKADPNLPAYTCSACPNGYESNGAKCADIDECTPTNPCTGGTCVNTAGSFRCDCDLGYRLDTDKVTCNDINECDEETDGCDQICVNDVGSFTCSCQTGYKRNAANTACEIDATDTTVQDACLSAGCENADGCTVDENASGICFCNAGYTLNETDNTCADTNECDLGVCSQDCTNTEGSYTCKCYIGYELAADKVTCNACTFPSYGLNCVQNIIDCQGQHATYDSARGCVCNAGWEGSDCGSDVNECLDANICGDVDKVCTNNRGSYTCSCRDGFQQQADSTCADIDECSDITANSCEQVCTNTVGGYSCGCNAGYNVDPSDATKCVDINECTGGTSGCEQICVNIDGGFNCACNPGYELTADRKTCKKLEDVCRAFTSKNCSDICTVVNNAPVCSCGNGFYLGTDEQTCIDVNECDNNTLNLCSVKSSCVNIDGGYTCSCEAGFRLENDQRTCTGCDEFTFGVNCANKCDCGVGASSCDSVTGCVCKDGWTGDKCDSDKDECQTNVCKAANEQCVNTPGSYECQCKSGYEKDGNGACININECNDPVLNTCSQVCDDTDGSFDCSCNVGFVQDGNSCNDINECEGAHGCEQICTNLIGSYRCSCPDNYQLNEDKRTCSAINACADPNFCSGGAICAQVNGNDTCSCKTGYVFDTGSTTSCVDIKECSDASLNNCNQKCTELPGSYSCSCNQAGYKLDADEQTCIVCEEGTYGNNCTETCACEIANSNTKSCDNVNGSCTCNPGWEGTTCATNINECSTLTEPCPPNSACVDNDGSYTCVCSTGYLKAGDGTCSACDSRHYGVNCAQECACIAANTDVCDKINGDCTCASGWTGSTCSENIDECQTANICNDTLKTCSDTSGSFTCSCIDGYTVNSENVCIDNNECLLGTDTCTDPGQKCVNAVPSFTCACSAGYTGTTTCTPCGANTWGEQCVNSCSCNGTNTVRCDPAVGCVCKQGWTGDDCGQDVDECALGTDNCVANAVCTNTEGNFTCACAVGYQSVGDSCISCSNNGHGDSCGTPCDCVDANAINVNQSCNHITGKCECKATWTGNRCQTDVDECAADSNLCKDKPSQGCHNLDGGYECSCFLGFDRNQDGTCEISSVNVTSVPVPADAVGIDMFVSLNLSVDTVSLSANLTIKLTNAEYKAETERALTQYFEGIMESTNLQAVKVYLVAEGSLDANLIVLIANTDAAKKDFSKAVYGFRGTPIDIFGQSTFATQLRVGTTSVDPQTATETVIKCIALAEANGQCIGDEECVIENGQPICRVKTTDNFALVIGLGVGIPLFFIAVLIIAVCILYVTKRNRHHRYGYRSSEFDRQTLDRGGFFPTVMPTKINTIGRNDPVYIPYNWDDQSTITSSSTDEIRDKKRRRRRRGETYPVVEDDEAYYSNAPNNFSWDFMYNYIGPNEKYEIQRPKHVCVAFHCSCRLLDKKWRRKNFKYRKETFIEAKRSNKRAMKSSVKWHIKMISILSFFVCISTLVSANGSTTNTPSASTTLDAITAAADTSTTISTTAQQPTTTDAPSTSSSVMTSTTTVAQTTQGQTTTDAPSSTTESQTTQGQKITDAPSSTTESQTAQGHKTTDAPSTTTTNAPSTTTESQTTSTTQAQTTTDTQSTTTESQTTSTTQAQTTTDAPSTTTESQTTSTTTESQTTSTTQSQTTTDAPSTTTESQTTSATTESQTTSTTQAQTTTDTPSTTTESQTTSTTQAQTTTDAPSTTTESQTTSTTTESQTTSTTQAQTTTDTPSTTTESQTTSATQSQTTTDAPSTTSESQTTSTTTESQTTPTTQAQTTTNTPSTTTESQTTSTTQGQTTTDAPSTTTESKTTSTTQAQTTTDAPSTTTESKTTSTTQAQTTTDAPSTTTESQTTSTTQAQTTTDAPSTTTESTTSTTQAQTTTDAPSTTTESQTTSTTQGQTTTDAPSTTTESQTTSTTQGQTTTDAPSTTTESLTTSTTQAQTTTDATSTTTESQTTSRTQAQTTTDAPSTTTESQTTSTTQGQTTTDAPSTTTESQTTSTTQVQTTTDAPSTTSESQTTSTTTESQTTSTTQAQTTTDAPSTTTESQTTSTTQGQTTTDATSTTTESQTTSTTQAQTTTDAPSTTTESQTTSTTQGQTTTDAPSTTTESQTTSTTQAQTTADTPSTTTESQTTSTTQAQTTTAQTTTDAPSTTTESLTTSTTQAQTTTDAPSTKRSQHSTTKLNLHDAPSTTTESQTTSTTQAQTTTDTPSTTTESQTTSTTQVQTTTDAPSTTSESQTTSTTTESQTTSTTQAQTTTDAPSTTTESQTTSTTQPTTTDAPSTTTESQTTSTTQAQTTTDAPSTTTESQTTSTTQGQTTTDAPSTTTESKTTSTTQAQTTTDAPSTTTESQTTSTTQAQITPDEPSTTTESQTTSTTQAQTTTDAPSATTESQTTSTTQAQPTTDATSTTTESQTTSTTQTQITTDAQSTTTESQTTSTTQAQTTTDAPSTTTESQTTSTTQAQTTTDAPSTTTESQTTSTTQAQTTTDAPSTTTESRTTSTTQAQTTTYAPSTTTESQTTSTTQAQTTTDAPSTTTESKTTSTTQAQTTTDVKSTTTDSQTTTTTQAQTTTDTPSTTTESQTTSTTQAQTTTDALSTTTESQTTSTTQAQTTTDEPSTTTESQTTSTTQAQTTTDAPSTTTESQTTSTTQGQTTTDAPSTTTESKTTSTTQAQTTTDTPSTTTESQTTSTTQVQTTTDAPSTTTESETTTKPGTTVGPSTTVADTTVGPTTTVADTTVGPTTTVADTTVGPTTTVADTTIGSTTTVADTTVGPTTTVADTTVGPTTTVAYTTVGPTTTVADTTIGSTTTVADTTIGPTTTVADTTIGSTTTVADTTVGSTTTVADTTIGSTTKVADTTVGTTTTVADTTIVSTTIVADTTVGPTTTVADTTIESTTTVVDTTVGPTTTVADTTVGSTTTVADTTVGPTTTVADTTDRPTTTAADTTIASTTTVADTTVGPTTTVADTTFGPTTTVADTTIGSTTTVADTTVGPTTTVADTTVGPTTTVADTTVGPTTTVADTTVGPITTVADTTVGPTTTVADTTVEPTTTVADTTVRPTTTVSTVAPTTTVADTTVGPITTVADTTVGPTTTVADTTVEPTTTVADTTVEPTTTVADTTVGSTTTVADTTVGPTTTVADTTVGPITTVADTTVGPTTTVPDTTVGLTTTVADTTFGPTTTVADTTVGSTTTVADTTVGPTTTVSGTTVGPTTTVSDTSVGPTTTVADTTVGPTTTVADTTVGPTTTVAGTTVGPTTTVADTTVGPTATVADTTVGTTTTVADTTVGPTTTVADTTDGPTTTVADTTVGPTTTVADTTVGPTTTVADTTVGPTTTVADTTVGPTTTAADTTVGPTTTAADTTVGPTTTVADTTVGSTTTVADTTVGPTTTVADTTVGPTTTVADTTVGPTTTVADTTVAPTTTVADTTVAPTTTVADTTVGPTTTAADTTVGPTTTVADTTVGPTTTVAYTTVRPTTTVADTTVRPTTTVADTTVAQTTTVADTTVAPTTTAPPTLITGLRLGYGETTGDNVMPGTDDECNVQINTEYDVPFREQKFRKIFVCANGLICFNRRYESYTIPVNDETSSDLNNIYCLAPYFADIDVENSGKVWYQAYDATSEDISETSEVFVTVKNLMNATYGVDYNPVYILKATWDNAPKYGGNASETVTFQVIYVTDGVTAYTFYNYEPDGMNFLSEPQFIGLLINGTAEGLNDSPDGSYLRRPDENLILELYKGAASFEVTLEQEEQGANYRVRCKSWHKAERSRITTYRTELDKMPLCPCVSLFLFFDRRFGFSSLDLDSGTFTVPVFPARDYAPYGKTCSYNIWTGSFIGSGRSAGSFNAYNELIDPRQHQLKDTFYKNVCCDQSDLCDLYYDVRPTHNCYSVFPFRFGGGFGDPHIATLDGRTYTFNGHGEYILLRIPTANFEIQSRTERAEKSDGTESEATIFTAFAIESAGTWLQVEINYVKTGINLFAGSNKTYWADFTADFYDNGDSFSYVSDSLSMSRDNNTLVTSFTATGVAFNVTVGVGLLQMGIGMRDDYKSLTAGLLGNFNDDATDDLLPRNAVTALPNTAKEREIFQDFGQTWLTSSVESIFKYDNGKSHSAYSFPDFVPKFLDEANETLVAEATSLCGEGNNQCIFDYVFTGNAELAAATTATESQAAENTADAANVVPNVTVNSGTTLIEGRNYLYTTVNQVSTFTLLGTDDGTLTYEFVNTTAEASLGTPQNDGTVDVNVLVSSTDPVYVSVSASDDRGVNAPVVDIVVVLCTGCNAHGVCNNSVIREDLKSTDSFKYATCVCEPYWTGIDCELDFDGCEVNPCSVNRTCTDRPADEHKANPSLKAYTCSPCPTGYQDIQDKCQDVNECSDSTVCSQVCVNTAGSYYCQCNSGFRLADDGTNCTDVNECEESTSGCDQICTNNAGSFVCSCYSGFTYNDVTSTCDKDIADPVGCDTIDCSSAAGCTLNETNVPVCFCNNGFQLQNGNTCNNIDECTTGVCSQSCTDTVGSFTCSCYTGFRLLEDQVSCEACIFPYYGVNCASTCQCGRGSSGCDPVQGCICKNGWTGTNCDTDVDECLVPNVCGDENKICTNTVGSYRCTCRTGFSSVNGTCTDVDECSDPALNVCNQLCTNTIGGFSCSCRAGYNIDPTDANNCVDFDECAAGISGCEQICTNAEGRFSCECYFGFLLNADRKTCTEVSDPCTLFPETNCSDICVVVNQTPLCYCSTGFVLGADQQTCIDVNECDPSLSLNQCSDPDTCVNSAGGYECSCNPGFKLENDMRTCKECDAFHYGLECANDCNCGVGASRCDSVTGCVCESGWTGDKCDIDKDECATFPCTGTNEQCTNTPGSYVCACETGYSKDINGICKDVDECSSVTLNDCGQICTNTMGSYQCSCNTGFQQDGNACNDINECDGQNECSQVCTNTVGSYRCSCSPGFKLDLTDRKTCIPAEQCDPSTNPCGANTDCAVVSGTDSCFCKAGFQFVSGSNTICEDILECSQIQSPCSQECTELAGSYQCSCNIDGYKLDVDQSTCIVCPEGSYGDDCLQNCTCAVLTTLSCDTVTGACNCKPGWTGSQCTDDINECLDPLVHQCPANSQCVNTLGSFYCSCDIGYTKAGNGSCQVCDSTHWGQNCENSCTCDVSNTQSCDPVDGSCTCNTGWTGSTCSTDLEECTLSPNICGDVLKTCQNTPGSFSCNCISGYTINNVGTCIDNDECLLGTSTCLYECTNNPGSFECSCYPGYSGTGNSCTPCASGNWGIQCANTCNCNVTYTTQCDPATGCQCISGWTGATCSDDIDECADGTHTCPADSTCVNTPGSYECPCNTGYKNNNNLCAICSDDTYGEECASSCDCENSNAVVSSQSCNHVTGTCECRATWTGSRCQTDVDECAAGTSNCDSVPNRGCHNTIGGFQCSCLLGYEIDNNGDCVQGAPTTPVPTSEGEITVVVSVRLNYTIQTSVDLRVTATFDIYAAEVRTGLLQFFETTMGSNVKDVVVTTLTSGSIDASVVVLMSDSETSAKQFSRAVFILATGGTVEVFEVTTVTQALVVGEETIDLSSDTKKSVLCAAYFEARGSTCAANAECVIIDENPLCQPLKTSDNFPLVIGLGVGVPLFLITALIIAIIVIYALKNRRKKRYHTEDFDRGSFNNGFFPHTIPTKISTWGRNNPVGRLYGPQSWGDESVSASTDEGKHHRTRRDNEFMRTDEMYSYENGLTSNFSWDFLYNYIHPHERYEIARPQHDQHPHPVFTQ